ncbi:N-(5'-phosphoribosyl)anthranilate isomerase [Abditibacteriota bacterium]|nr:N-(5'-phosphoribosyl)anthranilate isomerase [Abditibacteriota bacterium]
MEATVVPRVKVCCISSVEEGWMAIRHGAAALGLVSAMPSGPGVIEDALITRIAGVIPPGVGSFLLSSSQHAEALIAQQRRCRTNTLQLVDAVDIGVYSALREALPGIGLVQVIHVVGEESVEEALEVAPHVDALLLDSGNPNLVVKELGGTGRRHDWGLSRLIREQSDVPIYLAGGLTPDNVREAIETVGPFGLDVCSGVRTNGALDEGKLDLFTGACRV